MDRITVSIDQDQNAELERLVEEGIYDSKSEAVRKLLTRAQEMDHMRERIEELERERAVLLDEIERGSGIQNQPSGESFPARLRWLLFGRSEND